MFRITSREDSDDLNKCQKTKIQGLPVAGHLNYDFVK